MEKVIYDALVKEMISGGHAAYCILYDYHRPYIFSVINSKVADYEQARDLTQEVFMALWERRLGLELKQSLLSYLCGIAHNKCVDWINYAKKVEERKRQYARIKDAFSINDSMEREEALLLFYRAVGDISAPACKQILLLRVIEDKSAREIALELNITLQGVRNQLSRGTAIVKNFLKKR